MNTRILSITLLLAFIKGKIVYQLNNTSPPSEPSFELDQAILFEDRSAAKSLIYDNPQNYKLIQTNHQFSFSPQLFNSNFGLEDFDLVAVFESGEKTNIVSHYSPTSTDHSYLQTVTDNQRFSCDVYKSVLNFYEVALEEPPIVKKNLVFHYFNLSLLSDNSLYLVETAKDDIIFEDKIELPGEIAYSASDIYLLENENQGILVVYSEDKHSLEFFKIHEQREILSFSSIYVLDLNKTSIESPVRDLKIGVSVVIRTEESIEILEEKSLKDIFTVESAIDFIVTDSLKAKPEEDYFYLDFTLIDKYLVAVTTKGLVQYNLIAARMTAFTFTHSNLNSVEGFSDKIKMQDYLILGCNQVKEKLIELVLLETGEMKLNKVIVANDTDVGAELLVDGHFSYLIHPKSSKIVAIRNGLPQNFENKLYSLDLTFFLSLKRVTTFYNRVNRQKDLVLESIDGKLYKFTEIQLFPQRVTCTFDSSGVYKFIFRGVSNFCVVDKQAETCNVEVVDELVVVSKYFASFNSILVLIGILTFMTVCVIFRIYFKFRKDYTRFLEETSKEVRVNVIN